MKKFVFSLVLMFFVVCSAFAQPGACTSTLQNLENVTATATSLGSKDLTNLVNKAGSAEREYSIGKTTDALEKLLDYQHKLDQLSVTVGTPKAKISAEDEQTLRAALDEAIACLSSAG